MMLALGLVAGPAVAATHKMTGDVRAINADAKTFTVEQHKMLRGNKEHTFRVNDPALPSNLRTGERVRVAYEQQGQQLIAREVNADRSGPGHKSGHTGELSAAKPACLIEDVAAVSRDHVLTIWPNCVIPFV
jgi:Cu/Ag efflux protein CusF